MNELQELIAQNVKYLVARIMAWPMTGRYPQCFILDSPDGYYFSSGCMFDLDFDQDYNIQRARLNTSGTNVSYLGEFELLGEEVHPVNDNLKANGCNFKIAMNLLIEYKQSHRKSKPLKKSQSKKKTKLENLQGRLEQRIIQEKEKELNREEKRQFWKRPPAT